MTSHWRTTTAGIMTLLVTLLGVGAKFLTTGHIDSQDFAAVSAAVMVFIGLFHAADKQNVG